MYFFINIDEEMIDDCDRFVRIFIPLVQLHVAKKAKTSRESSPTRASLFKSDVKRLREKGTAETWKLNLCFSCLFAYKKLYLERVF